VAAGRCGVIILGVYFLFEREWDGIAVGVAVLCLLLKKTKIRIP
jgi:uncharacterized membrane protein (DUF4010 family)